MTTSSTTPAAAASPGLSTRPAAPPKPAAPPIGIGEIVLVTLDPGVLRPLIVAAVQGDRVSGTVFCTPQDYNAGALYRPEIYGQLSRYHTTVYADGLPPGPGIGEWRRRT